MTAFREDFRVLVSSGQRESALGTPQAVDRQLVMGRSYAPVADRAELLTDDAMATGSEGPTEVYAARAWHEGRLSWDLVRPDDFAFLMAYALGDVTTTESDTTAYRHVITENDSRALPSFTLEEAGWEAQQRYAGCFVSECELRLRAGHHAEMWGDVLAAGPKATGTGTASMVSGEPVLTGGGVHAWMGVAYDGSPALGTLDLPTYDNLQGRLRDFRFSVKNIGRTDGLYTFAGNTIARAERAPREFRVHFTMETENKDYIDYLHACTTRAVEIEWDSGVLAGSSTQNYGWQIAFPKLYLEKVELSFDDDGRLLAAIDAVPLEHVTFGRIQAVVWNKTASYGASS